MVSIPGRVFDLEGDGLVPTKIHCLVADTPRGIKPTTSYDSMRRMLQSSDILVGHNIIRFDIPVMERLLGVKVKARLVDTLALSWYLYPERARHGLAEWGEEFGVPKPPIEDWENLSSEEYIHRCTEDVKINKKLWDKQWSLLKKLYNSEEEIWHLIDYLSFKLDCAKEQERSGWKLNEERARESLKEFSTQYEEKVALLAKAMPRVPITVVKTKPAKPFKKDGSLSIAGSQWQHILRQNGLEESYVGPIEVVVKYEEPNPASHEQIKDWLYSLGWVPETFKYDRDKQTNNIRKIPQVRREKDGEKLLCPSVERLIAKEPALDYLKGITVLSHRMAILSGFLESSVNGYVKAEIGGLANTLRFKHRTVVNLPGVGKPYGKDIRGVLEAPMGFELCGSDMASLEDRTKQHFMWEHDPDYVREMNTPGFDPHLDIAVIAKMMTQEEVDEYKAGNHAKKPIRHKAKTANYALISAYKTH